MSVRTLRLREPSPRRLADSLERARTLPYAYEAIGASRTGRVPDGFRSTCQRTPIGSGPDTWQRANAAIQRWAMFDVEWIERLAPEPPHPGAPIVFAARTFGLWTLNACRVVYDVDERADGIHRYGFGYGTLGTHALAGEERFVVEWDAETDSVTFEIFQFSQIRHPVLAALSPMVHAVQRRFGRHASAAMNRAVSP